MKRCLIATVCVLLASVASAYADVTVKSTLTIAGPMSQMIGGAVPETTTRLKGTKSRMDMEIGGQRTSIITDAETHQIVTLNHTAKTAQALDSTQAFKMTAAAIPSIDAKVEPTGKTQEIAERTCSEYRYTLTLDMESLAANMGSAGKPMPPGGVDALKGAKMIMNGTMWVAIDGPGVAEFAQFAKAAAKSMQGGVSPFGGPMAGIPGMQGLMNVFSQIEGVPMLTEIETSFDGTGPMVDMMKTMGGMKITTKVTAISTEPLSDDLFAVPADYTTIEKKP